MGSTQGDMPRRSRLQSDQGGALPPPATFGSSGLPPRRPVSGEPLDVLQLPAVFQPGPPQALEESFSFDSECQFLEEAIAAGVPPSQQQMNVADDIQLASKLTAEEAEQMRQMLGQPSEFVAGQLFSHAKAWLDELQPSSHVKRWLLDGYSEFLHTMPSSPIRKPNSPSCIKHEAFVEQEVQALLACQGVEDVTAVQHDFGQVAAVLPLLVAEDPSRKDRVCWNGRAINHCMDPPSFKLEHAPKAAAMMKPGDFMFTVDMKSGYHQIPLKPSFRRLCCFQWRDRVYRWRVLPFGLSSAPRAYTKLSRCLLAYWRSKGIRVSNYIDDFIFFAATLEEALALRDRVLLDMTRFGWHVSLTKSKLHPAQRVIYLGFEFCSVPMCMTRVPASKIQSLHAKLGRAVGRHQAGSMFSGFDVARLAGTLQSMKFAVSPVGLFTRALYRWLAALPKDPAGHFIFSVRRYLSRAAALELQFWQTQLAAWNGATLRPGTFSRVLYTDASGLGWGGLVHRVLNRQEEPTAVMAARHWEDIASVDSVLTELQGLHDALQAFAHTLAGTQVLHRTDSVSTYWVVANAGSRRSERLCWLARRIWFLCLQHHISLASEYVGKDVIIRRGADLLSRWQDDSDCSLRPDIFAELWHTVGPLDVDRFASASNVQANPSTGRPLLFTSRFLEKGSLGMDALAASWRGVRNYAFPPPAVLDRVVQLIADQAADTLLICPRWPSQSWWPMLQSLPHVHWQLPSGIQPFVPGRSGCPHPCGAAFDNAHSLQFCAFWVCFS